MASIAKENEDEKNAPTHASMFLLLMTTPIQEVAYGMSSDYLLSLARAHILSVPMLLSYLYHQITVCHTEEIFPHVVD